MSAEPVNGWDSRVHVQSESAFGTSNSPAVVTTIETVSCNTGPVGEVGRTRPKQDRNIGRGHASGFVEGRVEPIPFELVTSVKSRSNNDDIPVEATLYRAGGMYPTASGGVSYTYANIADPIGGGGFSGLSLRRAFGPDLYRYEAEQLRGGVVRQLVWEGGDKELTLKAAGVGIGKYAMGYVAAITLGNGSVTTLTLTANESYGIGPGYYKTETEVILVQGTQANIGDTSRTIARAQLGSTGAAHAATPMYPYMASTSYSGSPISEAACTFTLDSVAMRALSASITLDTGMDLLPGETGSAYIQGVKAGRCKWGVSLKSVLHKEEAMWIGKVTRRKSVALTLVFGSTAGGIATFSFPQCEIRPFIVPDTAGDVSVVDLVIEPRDSSSGNDAGSLVMT